MAENPTPPGEPQNTPLNVIAEVSRVVTRAVDQIAGDRADYPLLVAAGCVEALKRFGVESRIMYGSGAWIEVLDDHSVIWAGCWGEHLHFWVATQYGEVVDLNTAVAYRKRVHSKPELKAQCSAPLLWSQEVPKFYRYQPEGVAELEILEERDQKLLSRVVEIVVKNCDPARASAGTEPEFPNEPILCPNRKLLDDSKGTFKIFDRALAVQGIPKAPF